MITHILQHKIDYWLEDADSNVLDQPILTEADIDHLEKMIAEGYNIGELCSLQDVGKEERQECRGWWKIKR